MGTLAQALGFEDETPEGFKPHLVMATVKLVGLDTAMLSFAHEGVEVVGVLPVTEQVPGEVLEVGQQIPVAVTEPVTELSARPRLSRLRRELITHTLAAFSPEVRRGDVRVMSVARKPGARTKIAVAPTAEGIDAIAACVGRNHNRVDAVRQALGGEQVDVIAWSDDKAVFLANALQPASVTRVEIDPETREAVAYTSNHQMSAAVGASGLNSSLAGRLTGLSVTIGAE